MDNDTAPSPSSALGRVEYLMYLRQMSMSFQDIESDLTRLNRDFGWRCVAFVPSASRPDGSIGGYFLLERPVHSDDGAAG